MSHSRLLYLNELPQAAVFKGFWRCGGRQPCPKPSALRSRLHRQIGQLLSNIRPFILFCIGSWTKVRKPLYSEFSFLMSIPKWPLRPCQSYAAGPPGPATFSQNRSIDTRHTQISQSGDTPSMSRCLLSDCLGLAMGRPWLSAGRKTGSERERTVVLFCFRRMTLLHPSLCTSHLIQT